MNRFSVSHLSDQSLLVGLARLVAHERANTGTLLAHIAEVDERELYLPAAYPSMFEYCVRELRLSEDVAYKRIQVARLSRRFPAILDAIAPGKVHVGGLLLLAPHLATSNLDELLDAATHRTRKEIKLLVARRFPSVPDPEEPSAPTTKDSAVALLAPGRVDCTAESSANACQAEPTDQVLLTNPDAASLAPGRVNRQGYPRLTPVGPDVYALEVLIDQATHDHLVRAQELMSHRIASRDMAQVLSRALSDLVRKLEKRKYAATERPRAGGTSSGPSCNSRTIPAAVRRAVRRRDGEQCTFVSPEGRRCCARGRLEFDHVVPVARGGARTLDNLRLRCRAHNQFEAERVFGGEFMAGKRAARRANFRPTDSCSPGRVCDTPVLPASGTTDSSEDLSPWLRRLGFRAAEIRHMIAKCAHLPGATLEERLRVALTACGPA